MRIPYARVLTPREQEVIKLLATGLTNEEIARQLGISLDGVKYHVSEILRRLGVENRHDAVSLHLRSGGNGPLAAWAPVMFLRKLPFAWLPKAAAVAVLTVAAAGIALLAWGVMSTSSVAVTTTDRSVEQSADNAASVAPGVAQAAGGADAITAISAGLFDTCALKDGGVWCWGGSFAADNIVPVAVSGLASGVSAISPGAGGTCALKDGGAWCWIQTYCCPGGGNFDPGKRTVPVAVSGLESGVSAISAGAFDFGCAIKDGGLWCWGYRGSDGAVTVSHVAVAVAVSGLASGVSAINGNCAVKDGGVWCWGYPFAEPAAVAGLESGVSAVGGACALKGGGVWCWGDNSSGQLGNNSPPDSLVPVAVQFPAASAGDIAAGPDAEPPSRTSTDSADHRAAYVLAGAAAAALAIVGVGVWAVRRRRRIV